MATMRRQGDVMVVEFDPRYDSLDEAKLKDLFAQLGEASQTIDPPWMVLDMSRTEFVGSAFIETIFRVWKRLHAREGRMALCGLQPFCAKVLRVVRLDRIWPTFATCEEAVEAIRKAEPEPQPDS